MEKESDLEWCEKDCKHRHYWERVGLAATGHKGVFVYYRCSQCHKWKRERLKFVLGGY